MAPALRLGLALSGDRATAAEQAPLPARVKRIVLHTLGSPTYDRPDRRFRFRDPAETFLLWKPTFGAHWIVWVDGSIWPRHVAPGAPRSFFPPADGGTGPEWQQLLSRQAAPVYSHVFMRNSTSVGIEVAHSGRSAEAFPPAQMDSLAWLLRTLLAASEGRLTEASIVGHKDLDQRPAFVTPACASPRCEVFVDERGRPFRWRVDPPESLFRALAERGLEIPSPEDGDADLLRAEVIPAEVKPTAARWSP
jgi:N-acetylmuramoyl-L-alanine amidase